MAKTRTATTQRLKNLNLQQSFFKRKHCYTANTYAKLLRLTANTYIVLLHDSAANKWQATTSIPGKKVTLTKSYITATGIQGNAWNKSPLTMHNSLPIYSTASVSQSVEACGSKNDWWKSWKLWCVINQKLKRMHAYDEGKFMRVYYLPSTHAYPLMHTHTDRQADTIAYLLRKGSQR